MERARNTLRGGGKKVLKKLSREYDYLKKAGVTRLARRYFVMNSFDGVLTTVGLLSGAYVGGIKDSALILTIGISAGIDGLSPFAATLVVLSPFSFYPAPQAYPIASFIAGACLFMLGSFLGSISKENALVYGFKMLLAGVAAAAASFLLLGG